MVNQDPSVINLDEVLEAADKVFATSGLSHELAVMELRSAVTAFRVQQTSWEKTMRDYLAVKKERNG